MDKWRKVATSRRHTQVSRIKDLIKKIGFFFPKAMSLEKPPEAVLSKSSQHALTWAGINHELNMNST